jgi:hypothetical protein
MFYYMAIWLLCLELITKIVGCGPPIKSKFGGQAPSRMFQMGYFACCAEPPHVGLFHRENKNFFIDHKLGWCITLGTCDR